MPESHPFARTRRRERARLARLTQHLRRTPSTIYELMDLEGCDRKTAWKALAYLRGELHGPRRIRVIGWRRTSGPPTAIYGRGRADDAPMARVSREDKAARHRQLHRERRAALRALELPRPAVVKDLPRRADGSLLHIAGARADDDLEADLDAIAMQRAAAIRPRRDAIIWALFGGAQ